MEQEIRNLARSYSLDDDRFISEIRHLAQADNEGVGVYEELMRHLVGKNLSEESSCAYWDQALDHRNRIEAASGCRISLRAALLDILHAHAGELVNPLIIEAEHLEDIRLSSVTDRLTGLYDQTHFKHFLDKSLSLKRRSDDGTSALILFDLDRFKHYNDRCGHLAGDDALHITATILKSNIREHDIAARYGGEEFALFLPNANMNVAHTVAERVRRAVEETSFPGQKLPDCAHLTISGGIAIFPDDAANAMDLIEAADRELYRAKVRRNAISPSSADRRRDERRRVQSLVEYTRTDREEFFSGIVYDISRNGIGFGSDISANRDDLLVFRFSKPFWSDDLLVNGRVRQVRRNNEGGLTYLGIEFDRALDDFLSFIPEAPGRKGEN